MRATRVAGIQRTNFKVLLFTICFIFTCKATKKLSELTPDPVMRVQYNQLHADVTLINIARNLQPRELRQGLQSSTETPPGCRLQARAPLSLQPHQTSPHGLQDVAIGHYLHIIASQ